MSCQAAAWELPAVSEVTEAEGQTSVCPADGCHSPRKPGRRPQWWETGCRDAVVCLDAALEQRRELAPSARWMPESKVPGWWRGGSHQRRCHACAQASHRLWK